MTTEGNRLLKRKALAKYLKLRVELVAELEEGYQVLLSHEDQDNNSLPLLGTTILEGRTYFIYKVG